MSRQIKTSRSSAIIQAQALTPNDPYLDKLIKLVPAEVISVYLFVFNLVKSQENPSDPGHTLQWIIFAIVIVILPFYLRKVAKVLSTLQIVLTMVSFCIWVLSMGGPLDGHLIAGYTPQIVGAVAVPLYTLLVPVLYDGQ